MINLKDKEVCVLGLGVSGFAACELLLAKGADVKVSEINDNTNIKGKLKILHDKGVKSEIGRHSEEFILSCGLIVVSPGVRFDLPVLEKARQKKIPVISEIELAYQFCHSKIVAVTGTNGKTTTVKLISHLLKEKFNVYEGGNLDIPFEIPFSSFVEKLSGEDIVVLEVSSFQLENILYFKPFISIILNVTADHLNVHKDMNNYLSSKAKIFSNQKKDDFTIINAYDTYLMKIKDKINSHLCYFSLNKKVSEGAYIKGDDIMFRENEEIEAICKKDIFPLPGEHNLENCLAAVVAARILRLNKSEIEKGLRSFQNVEHRLEKVGEIKGVEFVNDSKSTNVACVEKALLTLKAPLFLILGGIDKGNDYSQIETLMKSKVKSIFAIGESKGKISRSLDKVIPVFTHNTLEDAVKCAFKNAKSGEKILLSPACASFDMFKDYKDRGKQFKEIFLRLEKEYE
jgi:UDP-N-acetylmuramoylalanine--D-glutamate ligase